MTTWEDSLEFTFNRIYSEQEQVLSLTRDVLNAGANKDTEVVISALKHAATTAQEQNLKGKYMMLFVNYFKLQCPLVANTQVLEFRMV